MKTIVWTLTAIICLACGAWPVALAIAIMTWIE